MKRSELKTIIKECIKSVLTEEEYDTMRDGGYVNPRDHEYWQWSIKVPFKQKDAFKDIIYNMRGYSNTKWDQGNKSWWTRVPAHWSSPDEFVAWMKKQGIDVEIL